MKKLALFLALIMVVAACVIPVSAADETKTISFEAHAGDAAYLVADESTVVWPESGDQYYWLMNGEQLVYKFTLEGEASSAKITMPVLGVYEIWAGSTIEGAVKVYTSAQLSSFKDAYCGNGDNWSTPNLDPSEYTTVFEPLLEEVDLTSALDGTTLYVILKCTSDIPSDIKTGIWAKDSAVSNSRKYVNRRWNLSHGFPKDGGVDGSRGKNDVADGETYSDGLVTLTYTIAPDPSKGIPMLSFDQQYFGGLDTTNQVEGSGCCTYTFGANDNTVVFQKKFDAPVDVSGCEYVAFWFYISDASRIKDIAGGQIELTSSGKADAEEATYYPNGGALANNFIPGGAKDGWNLVLLPVAKPDAGNADWTRINFFRFYLSPGSKLAGVTVKFDNMFGITPPAPVRMIGFDKQYFGSLDELGHVDGTGCNAYTIPDLGSNPVIFQGKFDAPVDISGCKYVEFWLYLSDPAKAGEFASGQFELNASGGCDDNHEKAWNLGADLPNHIVGGAKAGWNLVRYDLTTGSNGADLTKINYFRFFGFGAGLKDLTVKFDNMYAYAETSVAPANNKIVNVPAAPEAAEGIAITLAPDAFKKITIKNDQAPSTTFDPVDISKCENIEFDMFISDADYFEMAIGQGEMEFGSKEACDNAELAISYKDIARYIEGGAKAGWNHVIVPIADLRKVGGDPCDLTALMRIRYYNVQVGAGINTVVALANFVASPVPAPEPGPSFVDIFGFETAPFGELDTENMIDGEGCASWTYNSTDRSVEFAYSFPEPLDLSGCDYLELWFYISDESKLRSFSEGRIELTSSGKAGEEGSSWDISYEGLYSKIMNIPHDGWNLIRLPIGGGDADWTRINFFRFYSSETNDRLAGTTVKFDMMYARASYEPAPDPVTEKQEPEIEIEGGTAVVPEEAVEIKEGEDIVIDVSGAEEEVTSVELGSELFAKIAEAAAKDDTAAVIALPDASLEIDADALAAISEQADGKPVSLSAQIVEEGTLNDEQKDALKDKEVLACISLEMFAGETQITDFRNGTVTVAIPFELPEETDGKDFYVAYVADDGTVTPIKTEYVDGKLVFSTGHFSSYVVLKAEAATTQPEDDPTPATFDAAASIAVVAVAAMGIVLVSSKKRH